MRPMALVLAGKPDWTVTSEAVGSDLLAMCGKDQQSFLGLLPRARAAHWREL